MSDQLDTDLDFDDEARERDVLKEAQERYRFSDDYWTEHQRKAKQLLNFIAGDQWDNTARQAFENNGYAAVTDNVIPSFLRQITNEMRQNTPVIAFHPLDNESQDAAEVRTDLVRNIQLDSNAEIAYDTAGWLAAATGLGYFRLTNEYCDPKSFDQKIVVKAIFDANAVLMDPSHRTVTAEDMDWCFMRTAMSKDAYKRKYPLTALTGLDDEPKGWEEAKGLWLSKEEVIVVEYFRKVEEPATLYRVLNTRTGETEDTIEAPDELGLADGTLVIINTRETTRTVIQHFVLNEVEILAETTWPGCYIPIIPVKGDELWIEGKRKLIGAVEPAVDSQVQLNYFLSLASKLVQMAPAAPYIGTARQFKDFEQQWADINVSGQAFLPYNKDDSVGPPSRDLGEVPIQNAMAICQQARDNLKQIFSIYDASLGAQSNEESGKAILARQTQSERGNFHFIDNLKRALQHAGVIMLDAIPAFYDTPRTIQTVKPDGTKSIIAVNGPSQIKLTEGSYGVVVTADKPFGTKRQEAVALMLELGRAYPQALPLISDLITINSDWPGAKECAARLRTAVPPAALQATQDDGQDPKVLLPQLRMQLSQQEEALKALNAHAQEIEQELETTKQTLTFAKMDKEADIRKSDQTFALKQHELKLTEQTTALEAELEMAKLRLEERKIVLQELELQMNATVAASELAGDMHDREVAHMDKVAGLNEPITGVGNGPLGGDLGSNGV